MDEQCHVQPVEKPVTVQQIRDADRVLLAVGGMGCSNCALRVRNALIALEGVYRADVYLNLTLAEVYYDSRKVSITALQEAVYHAGNDSRHEYHALVIATE